jgi:hypothetical protein
MRTPVNIIPYKNYFLGIMLANGFQQAVQELQLSVDIAYEPVILHD